VVTQADGDGQHRDQPHPEPQQLRRRHAELKPERAGPGQLLREAVEHDQPDGAHGGHRGKQQLVTAMAGRHQDDVRAHEERHVAKGQLHRTRLERPAQRDVGDDEAQRDEEEDRQQQPQLQPAPGDPHQGRITGRAASGRGRRSARRRS
jgi:hypothetical protein